MQQPDRNDELTPFISPSPRQIAVGLNLQPRSIFNAQVSRTTDGQSRRSSDRPRFLNDHPDAMLEKGRQNPAGEG